MIERSFSRKAAVCLISAIFINSASFSQNPRHPKAVMSGPIDIPVAGHESGVGLIKGSPGMRIVYVPQISDTFSQEGRLEVDVKIDRRGDVIDASYDVSGSTTNDGALVKLALATAYGVKFSQGDSTRSGTMVVNFRLYDSANSRHDRVDTISRVAGTRMAIVPTLSDDSIENASVAVDVTVDKMGNVTQASYQIRGSTTGQGDIVKHALAYAYRLKFSPADSASTGTVIIHFRIH